jgi:trehalose-phosphatase
MPAPVDREAIWTLLGGGTAGLATDFDGTVSPIVSPPEAARPLPGVEQSLGRLVEQLAVVALVSGRTIADLALRIDVPGAVYVGNHGLEWWRAPVEQVGRAAGQQPAQLVATPTADESRLLAAAAVVLESGLRDLTGVRLEDKGLGLAIHYRDAPDHARARELILATCHGLVGQRLQIREGKQVVELVLPHGTDKGTALERLIVEHRLDRLVFIGDDLTDRDGFAACRRLRERGVLAMSLAVLGPETPPAVVDAADATVAGPAGVAELLAMLAARAELASRAVPT